MRLADHAQLLSSLRQTSSRRFLDAEEMAVGHDHDQLEHVSP